MHSGAAGSDKVMQIYRAMIRSAKGYGCTAYGGAALLQ